MPPRACGTDARPDGERRRAKEAYLDNGWLASQLLGNAAPLNNNCISTDYTQNAAGQLVRLLNRTHGGTTLASFKGDLTVGALTEQMRYDGAGNPSRVIAHGFPAGPPNFNGTTNYTHDYRNRLTLEDSTRNGPTGFMNPFGFDAADNPLTFRNSTFAPAYWNAKNQPNDSQYAFNHNGSPTLYKNQTLAFDAEHRMTAYGSLLTAGYRGDGQRGWKSGAGGTTYFVYDGSLPLLELNASSTVTAVNTFGANGLLSRRESGSSTFYTFDPQGNVAQRSTRGTDPPSPASDTRVPVPLPACQNQYWRNLFMRSNPAVQSRPYAGSPTTVIAGRSARWQETSSHAAGSRTSRSTSDEQAIQARKQATKKRGSVPPRVETLPPPLGRSPSLRAEIPATPPLPKPGGEDLAAMRTAPASSASDDRQTLPALRQLPRRRPGAPVHSSIEWLGTRCSLTCQQVPEQARGQAMDRCPSHGSKLRKNTAAPTGRLPGRAQENPVSAPSLRSLRLCGESLSPSLSCFRSFAISRSQPRRSFSICHPGATVSPRSRR
jgi:hypothetical protein